MKIGMVVHAYYLKDARVRRYAESLARVGHDVEVLCLNEGDEPSHEERARVKILRVNMPRLRGGRLAYLYEYFVSSLRFAIRLLKLQISDRRYDVLHVHNMPNMLVFSALSQWVVGTKVILDLHDLMPEVMRSKYRIGPSHWLIRLLCAEEWVSTRFARALITANHAFADILIGRGIPPSKVTVVMNAPERHFVDAYDPTGTEERFRATDRVFHIMYTGTLAERYGVDIGIRAVARLKELGTVPRISYSIFPKIINEGEHVDTLRALIAELGVEDTVHVLDPVPHDEMPDVIKSADILLYTPVPDVHMDIALSLKIPEFMAVGRPVVASRLSVHLRYFGEDAMYMFEPGNFDECARKIAQIYADPDAACKTIRRARAKIEELSWKKQEATYFDLLDGLTSTPIAMRELKP